LTGVICDRQVQMRTLALEVDERELSTIEAALLLLQEQINALPEEEIMSDHGAPLTEREIGELARRIERRQERAASRSQADLPRAETLVEIKRAAAPALASKLRS
jgi:hypothetical protein